MDIVALLELSVKHNASDLHLSSGSAPLLRINGEMTSVLERPISSDELSPMLAGIMTSSVKQEFAESLEADFAFELSELGRFRVNVFNQKTGISAVFRVIPNTPLSLQELEAPQVLQTISELDKGLVLVTGPTGSGKSTTLAAMVEHINSHFNKHILTIEDPIEFIYTNRNSLISQRELHTHTSSFRTALKSALREDPDVILVGELRDQETISLALTAAETGHLVLATLHTSSAPQTINRVVDVFSAGDKAMIRSMLSESLQAVVCQKLMKRREVGRIACYEVMLATPAVKNLIREDKVAQIVSAMQVGANIGMVTMEQSEQQLLAKGLI